MKKYFFMIMMVLIPSLSYSQTHQNYEWKSNGWSWIGQNNGIAPLDSNKMMSAPVSGDTSSSPVTATGSVTARQLSDRAADQRNIKDYGAILSGSSTDESSISTAFSENNSGQTLIVPGGIWPDQSWYPTNLGKTKFVEVNGYLSNPPNTSVTSYGINLGIYNFGNGVTSETHGGQYFPNSVMFSRYSTGKNDTSYDPMVSYRQILDGASSNTQGNNTMETVALTTENSTGYATNSFDKLYSMGHNYYGGFDVNHWSRIDTYGTNWAWDGIQEFGESVTYFCNSGTVDETYCPAHYINEIDYGGYGSDDPKAEYNPDKATRTMYLLSTNTVAAKNTTRASWVASKSFWKYQQIIVKDSSGKPWIFYALPTGYSVGGSNNVNSAMTSSTEPTWNFNKGSTITDGDITWTCEGPFTYDIGSLIKISGGNNPSTGYVERIGTLMEESTDYIYNALFDMSTAVFDPSVPYNIFARLQKNMWFDLSADGTQAGQNNHLFGYFNGSTTGELQYKVSSSASSDGKDFIGFESGDDGTIDFPKLGTTHKGSGSHYLCIDDSGGIFKSDTACVK